MGTFIGSIRRNTQVSLTHYNLRSQFNTPSTICACQKQCVSVIIVPSTATVTECAGAMTLQRSVRREQKKNLLSEYSACGEA